MTVAELIAKLQSLPVPEAPVVIYTHGVKHSVEEDGIMASHDIEHGWQCEIIVL